VNTDNKTMSQTAQIRVHNPSESAPLLTVAMRLASPFTFGLEGVTSLLDPSILRQVQHNHWGNYDLVRAQTQQLVLVRTLEDHGARHETRPGSRRSRKGTGSLLESTGREAQSENVAVTHASALEADSSPGVIHELEF
jgi:hypothetical protein